METYVIHVTKECNLACTYCYEKDKTSTYTWEEVKELLDNIIRFRTSDEFHIEFLGGEPMLGFSNIKSTIEYVNSHEFLDVNYSITTNGTIINEELVDLLVNNKNLSFSISIDGTKVMNQMRQIKGTGVNSYDLIVKNFKTLKLAGVPVSQIPCHLTTTPFSIGYLTQGVIHLTKLGFISFGIGTIESTIIIGKEYCDRFISEMNQLSDLIKSGSLSVHISELESLKPRSDVRTYIRDETGKVIGETYGRSGDDLTKQDIENYNAESSESRIGNIIEDIREIVYNYHQGK